MSDEGSVSGEPPVAVIGAGTIGVAWAIVFARAGRSVRIFEPEAHRRATVPGELIRRLEDLAGFELLGEPASSVAARITVTRELDDAVDSATHVQECAPERVEVKQDIFSRLDRVAPPDATLASSSSAIACSTFAADLSGRERCLVVHPGNPPYLLPVVEIVPAPFTAVSTIERVEALMRSAAMAPVRVRLEVEGFVFNRLQGALLREAYCLVRDGVITPRDLDTLVSRGLGRRWSVIGPFATAELNTRGGVREHARRLGPAYARMGAERGQADPWTDDLVEAVAVDLARAYPPDEWEDHIRARDRALMLLERCRREEARPAEGQ